MNENLREMMRIMAEDETLQAKMKAAPGPDEAYSVACSIHGGYTKEEFVSFMRELQDTASEGELSDDDLAAVSGGVSSLVIITTIAVTAFGAAG